MRTKEFTRRKIWSPADVGADETVGIFSVKKGQRVVALSIMPLVAAAAGTDTTITIGDGDGAASYKGAVDLEAMTPGTPQDGVGAYFNQAGGKLYTGDDTIDVVYAGTTYGAVVPKVAITVVIRDERY